MKKGDKMKDKANKAFRPDRLIEINANLVAIGDKFKEATALHKSLAELQVKMEVVRVAALDRKDPLKAAIDAIAPIEVASLKDKLNSTNTTATRYNLLLQVLLDKELVAFDNYLKYLQDLQTNLVELLHFVLEHEGKFAKNYEGAMSWASVTDALTTIINTAIPAPPGGEAPNH